MIARCKIFLLLVISTNAFPQATFQADTTRAYRYYQNGLQYESNGNFDSAVYFLARSSALYHKRKVIKKLVEVQNKLAFNLSLKGDIPGAMKIVLENLQFCKTLLKADSMSLADTYHQLGLVKYFTGANREAITYFRTSLRIRENTLGHVNQKVASSINNLGILYETLELLDTARTYYEQYLDLSLRLHGEISRDAANAYNNLGGNAYFKGDYKSAIENYEHSLDIYKQVLKPSHPEVAASYLNLGAVYNEAGEYQKALDYTLFAASSIRENYGEESPQYLNVLLNSGTIYASMGKQKEALENSLAGYKTAEKIYGEENPSVAKLAMNIGTIYHDLSDYDSAIWWQTRSLELNKKFQGEESFEVGSNYNNLSNAYFRLKNYREAEKYIRQSISAKQNILGIHHQSLAFSYINLLNIYFYQKKFLLALRAGQRGLIANHFSFADTTLTAVPPLSDYSSAQTFSELLIQKASSFYFLYTESKDESLLEAGLEHLLICDSLLTRQQFEIENQEDLIALSSDLKRVSAVASMICTALYKLRKEKHYLDRIFYFKERSRGAALRLAITQTQAGRSAGLSQPIRARQIGLQKDLSADKTELAQLLQSGAKESDPRVSHLRTEIFKTTDEYARLVKQIGHENPKYYRLRYSTKVSTPVEVQSTYLRENPRAALVQYSIIDSSLNILVLTRRDIVTYDTFLTGDLTRRVRGLRNAITNRVDDQVVSISESLYDVLWTPVEHMLEGQNGVDQVIIIPDGILSYLPFEVLMAPRASEKKRDFSRVPFLCRRYRISYAISATQLVETYTAPQPYGDRAFVAFAPVFSDGSDTNFLVNTAERSISESDTTLRDFTSQGKIPPIPHSEDEVVTIKRLFDKKNLFARYFIFKDATEEALKDPQLSSFKYIHLATHGIVNDRYPELSALLMAQDSTGGNDGLLYAGEIYGLEWNAELVTLSACETGLGKIAEGEGILGLTRGFMYAGARNLLVSLWKVSDASTSQLMISFYNGLLSGMQKPVSLQKAKLKLIASKKFNHPYYWAPFVLVGY